MSSFEFSYIISNIHNGDISSPQLPSVPWPLCSAFCGLSPQFLNNYTKVRVNPVMDEGSSSEI